MRLFIASISALLVLGACSSDPASTSGSSDGAGESGATSSISAVDNAFEPEELSLAAGEEVTVTFTNEGDAPHTFTSTELGFDTGSVEPGDSAEVTFTAPDQDTTFICTIHEASDEMVGTISAK